MTKEWISMRLDKNLLKEIDKEIERMDCIIEKANRTKVVESLLERGLNGRKRKL